MAKCSFCSTTISFGTGKTVIDKAGKITWLCSRKCEKNLLELGREPRKFKWARHAS